MSPRPVERPARAWRSEGVRVAAEVGTPPAPRGPRAHRRLPAFTCRCPQGPLGSSTCAPAPRAAAADPGSCPAAPSPLLPGSETAAPSGTLPTSSRRRSPLPALRAAAPRPPSLSPAGGAREPGRLHHLREAQGLGVLRGWGADCKLLRQAGERGVRGARPARESRGPGRLARDGHAEWTDLPDSALGCTLPLASSWAGERRAGCGKQAGARTLHQVRTTKRRRSRLSPGKNGGAGSRGVNTRPSC